VCGEDPLVGLDGQPLRLLLGRDAVHIHRAAGLEAEQGRRPNVELPEPGPVLVDIARITAPRDVLGTPVAEPDGVAHPQRRGRERALDLETDEMDRLETRSETDHLRAAHRCLEPQPMVKGGVPVVDRCVVSAGRELERVAEIVAQDQPFDLQPVFIRPRCGADLGEKGDTVRQSGGRVSHQLPEEEAFIDGPIGLDVVDVPEAQDLELQARLGPSGGERPAGDHDEHGDERKTADRHLPVQSVPRGDGAVRPAAFAPRPR
jgi:hypothetical protein